MAIPRYSREFDRFVAPAGDVEIATVTYGERAEQCCDLRVPATGSDHPVVVLIHGGFWQLPWDRRLMNALAADCAMHGLASWNIEYARLGGRGGWPQTFVDVAAAVDALAVVAGDAKLDLSRVVTVGHSAGGQLALWLTGERQPATPATGVRPLAAASLAGVLDLERGWREGVGGDRIAALLGGTPDAVPDRYAAASPQRLLPLRTRQLIVHGEVDAEIPVQMSVDHAAAARRAGDDVTLDVVSGCDHYDVIDPRSAAWQRTRGWISAALSPRPASPA